MKQNNPSQHILIIGKVWPEPSSSAAGSRMMQLAEVFLSEGWRVSFASAANDSPYMTSLEAQGIQQFRITLNHESFDAFVKELAPDIVLFDRFTTEEQFGWRVAKQCPDALRILDTEDLHCLRAARHKALKELRPFSSSDLVSDIAKRELASIYRCDLSLIISQVEMQLLKEVFRVDNQLLHYIPFLLDPVTDAQKLTLPSFSGREHFISIGNFLHEPNWDAVLYLKQSIWPLIRKRLPKARLHVYGAYPSHKVFALHNPKEGFLIKGRAEDVKEVMAASRLCLAPLRFGAGIKGKLSDAMQYGTPSVTTSIGAESMHGTLPWNGAIEDEPAAICEAAVKLYTNETVWQEAQENGFRIISACYSKDRFSRGLLQIIHNAQATIKERRLQNFTGAMLMHHTVLSSRYMALWIEAKNRQAEF